MNLDHIDKKYEYWVNMHNDGDFKPIAKMYADNAESAEICLKSITEGYLEELRKAEYKDADGKIIRDLSYIILQVPRNMFDEDRHGLN